MRSPMLLGVASLLLLMALVTAAELSSADACAIPRRAGEFVEISDETAIIVWDAETRTEHFIRVANFNTAAADFGFLVPTPNPPSLEEVDQAAFAYLADLTKPEIIYKSSGGGAPRQAPGGCGCAASPIPTSGAAPAAAPEVHVLEERRLAGQDVAVLQASDASALEAWLLEHDYEISPQLKEWVQPYLDDEWTITAFKFARDDEGNREISTAAVRMTFETDRPFYPYREPEPEPTAEEKAKNQPQPSRLLRVFFIGKERVQGTLDGEPWHAETVWSRQISPGIVNPYAPGVPGRLQEMLKLPDTDPDARWHVTEFEDRASPRPATADLYFERAETQETVERPPVTVYVWRSRGDVSGYLLALLAGAMLLCRKSRRTVARDQAVDPNAA
jgi:hypothetical protein